MKFVRVAMGVALGIVFIAMGAGTVATSAGRAQAISREKVFMSRRTGFTLFLQMRARPSPRS
jgi:hypothetical protein